jgi:hypothetical protein
MKIDNDTRQPLYLDDYMQRVSDAVNLDAHDLDYAVRAALAASLNRRIRAALDLNRGRRYE